VHWTEFYPALCRLEAEYRGRLQGLWMKYGLPVHDMEHERARVRQWEQLVEQSWPPVCGGSGGGEGKRVSLAELPADESVQVVELVEALVENRNEIHVVNLPNRGAIDNLPYDAIVEVSCLVGGYGIRPVHVGPLPEPVAATLRQHITVQELTVEAALSGDRHVALQAFLQDPQIAARLAPEETAALLDELLEAHADYLPQFC
jgi:alpha-galactosidase